MMRNLVPGRKHWWLLGLLLAVAAAYSNHFGNGFHFDDFHTVQYNPAIRSLSNIPRFFSDARTFSLKAAGYRPIVTTSLAIDYALAGGLEPFWFHASTFVWFLAELFLIYLLCLHIFDRALPGPWNEWLAWLATAVYGLHPASAETVNYIVQRGDLYAALAIVAGVVIYARAPGLRRYGLYLLPPLAGMFAKPTALIFAPILLAYIILFDRAESAPGGAPSGGRSKEKSQRKRKSQEQSGPPQDRPARESLVSCFRRSLPAFALCGAFSYFAKLMTPAGFVPTTLSSADYWITQPYVTLRYVRSFFVPLFLNADTDLAAFHSIWNLPALLGCAFCAAIIGAAIYSARFREWRPVSFGLWWFLLGLVPTAIYPLAEVENDHRMFLPFVGLAIATPWTVALLLRRPQSHATRGAWAAAAVSLLILTGFGWETHRRNAVWHNEATLWRDATEKSPRNARAFLNYGFALLADGAAREAYASFRQASLLRPNYGPLEENLGVASGALCRDAEAESHFQTSLRIAPYNEWAYIDYAGWLVPRGRVQDALNAYSRAAELNRANLDPRYGLLEIYAQQSDWPSVRRVSDEVLRLSPQDPLATAYGALAQNPRESGQRSDADGMQDYLNQALSYRHAKRYQESIQAAHKALAARSDLAEAYIEIAASNIALERWDDAIAASREALRLKPSFAFALKDLAWALSRRDCGKLNSARADQP